MKFIVTGATGFIGGEVVHQCIQDPEITQIFILSRRPLTDSIATHPKVTEIIHKDFSSYPESLLKQLSGAEACIWTVGVAQPKGDPRPVDIGYTQAASAAFERYLQPQLHGTKFRFVHTSGILSEKDQQKSLWFNAEGRKSRGASETEIMAFAEKHPETYISYVVRAGKVIKGSWAAPVLMMTSSLMIRVEDLAAAMVDIAKKGEPGKVFTNRELIQRARGIHSVKGN